MPDFTFKGADKEQEKGLLCPQDHTETPTFSFRTVTAAYLPHARRIQVWRQRDQNVAAP